MEQRHYAYVHFSAAALFVLLIVDDVVNGRGELKGAVDGFFLSVNLHWGIKDWVDESGSLHKSRVAETPDDDPRGGE